MRAVPFLAQAPTAMMSQDGKYSIGKEENVEAHRLTIGAHATNDRVESNFGGYDSVLRIFESISVEAASGIAQQMRMHHLDAGERHRVGSPQGEGARSGRRSDSVKSLLTLAARGGLRSQLGDGAGTQERRAGQIWLYGRTCHPWGCTGQP